MKHNSKLLLLPMAALLLASFSACGGLTDEEKKFLGTWSCESYGDIMIDDNIHPKTRSLLIAYWL